MKYFKHFKLGKLRAGMSLEVRKGDNRNCLFLKKDEWFKGSFISVSPSNYTVRQERIDARIM